MSESKVAPYGSWKSPITSELIAHRTTAAHPAINFLFCQVAVDGQDVYWADTRPWEGRTVVVRRAPDGRKTDLTPPGFSAQSLVHDFPSSTFTVRNGTIFFSNLTDQRLYRQDPGAQPRPITPQANLRYADGVIDGRRSRMICVREDHTVEGREPVATLVALDLDGSGGSEVLVSGNDFYSSPRLSPDGSYLAWLAWNHPHVPWNATELWVAELKADGSVGQRQLVAGGPDDSIFQPQWSPDGILHFVSERSGWWNLHRWRDGRVEPLCEMDAEFGMPQAVFGMSTYAFAPSDRIICTYHHRGFWYLACLGTETKELQLIETPYTEMWGLRSGAGHIVFAAGSPTQPASIVQFDPETRQLEVFHRLTDVTVDRGYVSTPQAIAFPTEDGQTAHALFYPPKNRDFAGPSDEKPPLLVNAHGGPHGHTFTTFRLDIQYFTSHGIAYLDVDYGGSSGYGRAYRQRLMGQWGVVDVDDCVNGARWLVEQGQVDGARLMIKGDSAGGYTALCALTFRDVFKGGAVYFGISDMELIRKQTVKITSHYPESLIGAYPEQRDLYYQRSPIHHTDQLSRPVIFFQGLLDTMVPPNQTQLIVEALREKGVPVEYIAFEDEGHGIMHAENMKRALDAELEFYAKTLGFELAT